MKRGDSISNELKRFYKITACNSEFFQLIRNTDAMSWINIFDAHKIILGISQTGEWVLEDAEHFYILNDKKLFLYCVRILETPYEIIRASMEERFEVILQKENIDVLIIFPFYEIVEFTLNNLIDDYWFELAFDWYKKLELSVCCQLIGALERIAKNKKISQKNRLITKKEVKRLKVLNSSYENK